MRKYYIIIFLFLLCSCTINSPTIVVEDYLNYYQNLNDEILLNVDKIVDEEKGYNGNQKEIYKKILRRQYSNLKYHVIDENIKKDTAYVRVEIEVYNFYYVEKIVKEHLKNNIEDFYNENNVYDISKYIDYKLDKYLNNKIRIKYEIEFKLYKDDNGWNIEYINEDILKKIHGIYK